MKKCDCGRDATTLGKCHRCYQLLWNWMRKGPRRAYKHLENRRRQMAIIDEATGANVIQLKRRSA